MERDAVHSEAIASIGYDPPSRVLEVEFAGGGIYRYFDVPPEVYERFLQADSKGRFITCCIKPAYPYQKWPA